MQRLQRVFQRLSFREDRQGRAPSARAVNQGRGVLAHVACVLFPAAVTATGCLGSMGVKEKHAAAHACSSGDVTLKELDNEGHAKYQSTGCGHQEVYYCIVAKCISPRILSVRHHAAEHDCKMKEITTEEPTPNEFVTTGCGQTDRYRCKEVPDAVIQCDRVK